MKEDIARIEEERGGEKGGREGKGRQEREAGEGRWKGRGKERRGEEEGEGEGKERGGRRGSQERDEMYYGRDTYLFCTEPTSLSTSIIHTYFLAIWDSALHQ